MKVTVSGFSGAVNAPHPKLLPETVGTVSWNQKPGRGDFRPWRDPLDVATVPAGRKTIYRFGRDVAEDGRYWMSWTGMEEFFTPMTRGFFRISRRRGMESATPASWGIL